MTILPHRRAVVAALTALALSCPAAAQQAAEIRAGDLVITPPWTRATPGAARIAGGYMTVRNTGSTPDRLVEATFEVAGRVEIHEMATVDGVMRMRPLPGGIEIPAGGTVEFRPGGYHVMFLDLTRALRQGDRVTGTLRFERAGSVSVTYRVEAPGSGGGHRH